VSLVGLQIRIRRSVNRKAIGLEIKRTIEDRKLESGSIVTSNVDGQEVSFFVADAEDEIQQHHFDGRFYEAEDLELIRNHFNGGVFVDVGANVGNHTLFVAKYLNPQKVIAVEPNPVAYRILKCNLALNDVVERVELHEVGLSDKSGRADLISPEYNLGGARLVDKPDGSFPIVQGDEVINSRTVDFIKIDTEGLELQVIAGLAKTIERSRPVMFVEVDDNNIAAFDAFLERHGYRLSAKHKRNPENTNMLVVPA
jgi:FkbM family methyltransferase